MVNVRKGRKSPGDKHSLPDHYQGYAPLEELVGRRLHDPGPSELQRPSNEVRAQVHEAAGSSVCLSVVNVD